MKHKRVEFRRYPGEAAGAAESGVLDFYKATRSPEGRTNIDVDFVYVHHAPEDAEKVWEEVKGADIIYLESVGGSRAEREDRIATFNMYLAFAAEAPNHPKVEDKIAELRSSPRFNGRFLAEAMAGGWKGRIEFVDITEEHPAYTTGIERDRVRAAVNVHLANGEVEKALKRFPKWVELSVEEDKEREDLVLE